MTGRRIALTVAGCTLAFLLSACSDKPVVYKQGQYQGKEDSKPWNNRQFNGNQVEWEKAIKARNQGQDEYSRSAGERANKGNRTHDAISDCAIVRVAGGDCCCRASMLVPLCGAVAEARRRSRRSGNSRSRATTAPVWREVRKGDNPYQTTQVRGVETNVLVQSAGQTWRQLRPPVALAGGLLIVAALLAVFAYYEWRGPIGVHEQPTGKLVKRFSDAERLTHWTVAISVCILGITGLIISFGKYVLLPIIGYTLFSWVAIFAKNLHNFVAPVFLCGLPVMIVLFIRDNLPETGDLKWMLDFGGLFSKSEARDAVRPL